MTMEFRATGTIWKIDIESTAAASIESLITGRIRQFEQLYSRFSDTSFVAKISNTIGQFKLPEDSKPLLDLYFELFDITGGLFTPLIGRNLNESGYDKEYSLIPKKLSAIPDIKDTLEYDFPNLTIKKPVQFDFGGAGKGHLVDIISNLLVSNKLDSFVINAGGDILHRGKYPISIGLEHPADKFKVIGKVEVSNCSICASSANRRNWGKFHHIIDPKKRESPKKVLSTWVIAPKAIIADALATCLFLVPPEKLNGYYSYEYFILYSDFSIKKSEGFAAEIYSS